MSDLINSLFELCGSIPILLSCRTAYREKQFRGMHSWHMPFFLAWGVWNLYYYPSLGQWKSFVGGLAIVLANSLYVGMFFYYRRKESRVGTA